MSQLRTVLGDIDSAEMGITLAHEHILCDSSSWFQDPTDPDGVEFARADPVIENLWWMRQHPNSNRSVLTLDDTDIAVRELAAFKQLGGRTVIDLTSIGLGRDPEGIAEVSRRTGLNVVLGTGFYVAASHSEDVRSSTVDELTERIIQEIEVGIGETGIRAGVIGEVGMSHPLAPSEERSLRAAARGAAATGAAISVHTAAHAVEVESALIAADILGEEGADLSRVVMGHMDTTLHKADYHRRVLELGCYVEFDLFGHEFFESENDFISPGDYEKTKAVSRLVDEGFASQLLLSHDICYKIQLRTWGGYGYAHLLQNIIHRFVLEGVPESTVLDIMTQNPARVFPLES